MALSSALERGSTASFRCGYTRASRTYGSYPVSTGYLITCTDREERRARRAHRPISPPLRSACGGRAIRRHPGAVVAAILTIMVGGFFAYLGYELINFAREPELRITEPAGNVNAHTELTIAIRGVTEPNARVTVSNLTENPSVTADGAGLFEVVVNLVPGSNVVKLEAYDSVTNRTSPEQERTIIVVSDVGPSPSTADGARRRQQTGEGVLRGPVTVAGTTAPGAR